MRRRIQTTLAATLLLATAATAERLPVAWVSPEAASAWVGGESIILEWRSEAAWPRELEIEEWEAFLSLDGGRSYPVRLTPHLESDLRAVRVTVPNLPTEHARLLLRFGDERRETEWVVPGEFAIRAGAAARASATSLSALPSAKGRGESVRPGQRGVLLWAEGRRDGGDWRAASAAPGVGMRPAVEPQRDGAGALSASESPNPEADRSLRCCGSPAAAPAATGRAAPRSRRGIAILRLIERQNE
jgi:hypothetical protein